MPNDPAPILILAGTAEARQLAARLAGDARYSPITSLAGVTAKPSKIEGRVRTGGFGGAAGLAEFLRAEQVRLMVDATHPFAAQISANATQASKETGVPCIRLERHEWARQAGDDWTLVPDIEAAAKALTPGARALVTVGRQEAGAFFAREDIHLVARMIEPPDRPAPEHAEIRLARPPFTLEEETALMREKHISVLVTKNSGGDATHAKIEAARALGLPVVMIARPKKPPMVTASSVEETIALIDRALG